MNNQNPSILLSGHDWETIPVLSRISMIILCNVRERKPRKSKNASLVCFVLFVLRLDSFLPCSHDYKPIIFCAEGRRKFGQRVRPGGVEQASTGQKKNRRLLSTFHQIQWPNKCTLSCLCYCQSKHLDSFNLTTLCLLLCGLVDQYSILKITPCRPYY